MKIVPDITFLPEKHNRQQEERQAPSELKFVGATKRVRGHILFSYNEKTGEWKRAEMKRNVEIGIDGLPVYKSEVTKEPNCIYIQALNLNNAKKKLRKISHEIH